MDLCLAEDQASPADEVAGHSEALSTVPENLLAIWKQLFRRELLKSTTEDQFLFFITTLKLRITSQQPFSSIQKTDNPLLVTLHKECGTSENYISNDSEQKVQNYI